MQLPHIGRIQAALIRLGISLLLFGLAWLLIRLWWYPDFFFWIDGGWQGLRLIILADLVLGPLLTYVVFKAGKPGLKFDLGVLAVIQALAFTAGMTVVYLERPLALVYVDGAFFSMSGSDYRQAGLEVPALYEVGANRNSGPPWIQVAIPEDYEAQSELRLAAMQSGTPLRLLTQAYEPFTADDSFRQDAFDLDLLKRFDQQPLHTLDWRRIHGPLDAYRYYPIGARHGYVFLGFNRETDALTGVLWTPHPAE